MTRDRPEGVIPPEQWPECLRGHPELKGVFVGGCVDRGVGSSFRAKAHAHTRGGNVGWICIRGWRRLAQKSLLIHELAHIKTSSGHTDKWRKMLRALGGKVTAQYQKKRRPLCFCGAIRLREEEGAVLLFNDNKWHDVKACRPKARPAEAGGGR